MRGMRRPQAQLIITIDGAFWAHLFFSAVLAYLRTKSGKCWQGYWEERRSSKRKILTGASIPHSWGPWALKVTEGFLDMTFFLRKNGCIPQSVYDYVPFPSKRGTSAKWKHLPNSGLCFKVDWIPREFQQSPTTPRAIFKLTTIKCRFWHLSSSLLLSSIFLLHSPPSPLGERVGGKRENVHIRGRFIKAQSSLNGVWKMRGYFTLESLYTLLHKRSLGV